jgi:hypothetical protein
MMIKQVKKVDKIRIAYHYKEIYQSRKYKNK